MSEEQVSANKKIITGKVVSDKMDKTVVIEIVRKKLHRLYKKYHLQSKRVKVHDENNECHENDIVKAIECRPLSKEKNWRLLEIVERAK